MNNIHWCLPHSQFHVFSSWGRRSPPRVHSSAPAVKTASRWADVALDPVINQRPPHQAAQQSAPRAQRAASTASLATLQWQRRNVKVSCNTEPDEPGDSGSRSSPFPNAAAEMLYNEINSRVPFWRIRIYVEFWVVSDKLAMLVAWSCTLIIQKCQTMKSNARCGETIALSAVCNHHVFHIYLMYQYKIWYNIVNVHMYIYIFICV